MKCDQPPVTIIRADDPFCKDCFNSFCHHKFRSAFGKSRLIRDQENVLVGFSGGNSSSALLHLIQEGLSKRAQKKLRFSPTVVYIDEGSVLNGSSEERTKTCQEITKACRQRDLPLHVHTLEEVFLSSPTSTNDHSYSATPPEETRSPPVAADDVTHSPPEGADDVNHTPPEAADDVTHNPPEAADDVTHSMRNLNLIDSHIGKMQDLLSTCKTLMVKENLVFILRQRLLVQLARQYGCEKILLGDSTTRLAVRMLSNVSQGRGAHLPYEMSFADSRYDDVMFVRPIREFTSKEIAVYNVLNKVQSVFVPNLSTKVASSASIERLTEKFVVGLQTDYRNTVSTILRTGEKLSLAEKTASGSQDRCSMCQGPLDTDVGLSSAINATEFSRELAEKKQLATSEQTGDGAGHCEHLTETGSCSGIKESCLRHVERFSPEQFKATVCYGCRLVVRDMFDTNKLPEQMLAEANHRMSRAAMKEEIQEFLLEENP